MLLSSGYRKKYMGVIELVQFNEHWVDRSDGVMGVYGLFMQSRGKAQPCQGVTLQRVHPIRFNNIWMLYY